MFSLEHIVFLIFFLTLSIILGILFAVKKVNYRWLFLWCMIICILSEASRVSTFIAKIDVNNGYYIPMKTIPLHLCSIQIIFIFLMGLTKNEDLRHKMVSFFIPTAMLGGFMALVIPSNLIAFGPWHHLNFQYFIYHAMLIMLALYLYIREYQKLDIRSYVTCLKLIALLMVGSIFINSALQNGGANFFYTALPPADHLPLLNFNHGWHIYMLNLIWIGVVMITLGYLPVLIREIKKYRTRINN